MGVQGLWKLLESVGHTVPLESMCHKVLAVDVSIWLNQIIKAMRDADGNRVANAHIIAVYHRICKLLFYHVKPIFVFDGAVPDIKRRTCAKRKALKHCAADTAQSQKKEKLKLSLQKLAVAHVMGKEVELPQPVDNRKTEHDKSDIFYLDPQKTDRLFENLNSDVNELQHVPLSKSVHFKCQPKHIDPFSNEFKSLPVEIQHELLLEHIDRTKERAKAVLYAQNTTSDSFSQNQIENVVTKNNLNTRLNELRKLLKENKSISHDNGHSVQVFKSGQDSEIVFTKQINNVEFDIVDTREHSKVKEEESIDKVRITNSTEVVPETAKSDDMKNLFFGSDSDDDKTKDSDSESDKDRELTNVFGLSRGHPGTFRNPYSTMKPLKEKSSNVTSVQLKVTQTDFYDVSSSSDSEFETVEDIGESEEIPLISDKILQKSIEPGILLLDKDHVKPEQTAIVRQSSEIYLSSGNEITETMEDTTPEHRASPDKITAPIEPDNIDLCLEGNETEASNGNTDSTLADKMISRRNEVKIQALPINRDTPPLQGTPDLESLHDSINQELQAVKEKHRKAMSVSDTVNKGIITDVKELLTIFGIPFLDAPGEAEAQCAELCTLALCDGVITDDSDVFLFGDVRVYKDVFKKDRDMRCYTSHEIHKSLGLSRRELIDVALLVGSDYCTGVRGIGCVLALEIISKHKSLTKFIEHREKDIKYKKFDFCNLPNQVAVDAYLHPKVNSSKDTFYWNDLDVSLIKDFLLKKLDWRSSKVEETLNPVLLSLNDKTKEKSITSLFTISQTSPSKRVQTALQSIKGGKRKTVTKNKGKAAEKRVKYVCSEDSDSS